MKKYSEILALAKAEFKHESNWNKDGFFFRDITHMAKDNKKIIEANCMCGMGAAIKVNTDDFITSDNSTGLSYNFDRFIDWVDSNVRQIAGLHIGNFYAFNDDPDTKFTDLHNMFDKLIELAKAEGI